MDFNSSKLQDQLTFVLTEYGLKAGMAILFLIVGFMIANKVAHIVANQVKRKSSDNHALIDFITSLVKIGLKVIILIAAIGIAGVETTSFIAMLGSAGLAIGLALQGSLANIAGGALLLTLKPMKKGELIEAQGHLGVVEDIGLFATSIVTPHRRHVFIPNGGLAGGVIKNYTREGFVRCDVPIGISYDSDIKKARQVLLDVIKDDKRVLTQPEAPVVWVTNLGDSSVDLQLRVHLKVDDYWAFLFETLEAGKIALDNNGIEIPFPQRVVHMKQEAEA
ncbi:mechanosensitive ion channel [Flammeovirga yaeyamensis]|uniref:Mechanosensitive ion channel n=1 Tax=Flammeovirga yaeyamensis TaxID=367791 RepID=A0AAX1N7L9_9BACT|nr:MULTISPECIES: mechanosensitive ion channel domain-containing protein [Flammeovirga]ANQ49077.2 mechanosensitive ion channel [Flammeovirga sp. MY04]MBB3698060.1 small conductance mechanosensitive channel [Flammeovirga yaeyamensis]NMF35588.1 mechanosensitive ion channel [Flammeovirga yaeyamensis]QWG03454.1 mechanosensitive ion channel [Flammeovirga yaeyamensis]